MDETYARDIRSDPSAVALATRLHAAAIAVLRSVRSVDTESGVTAARLSALSVVVYGGPLRLTELAAAEQVSAPTMSRMVKAMEDDRLVARRGSPDDGRVVLVESTPLGRETLERARVRRVGVLAEALAGLGSDRRADLARGLKLLEEVVGVPGPPR